MMVPPGDIPARDPGTTSINPTKSYRTDEVAAILSCSIRLVQYQVKARQITSYKVGRSIRIHGHALIHFIETSTSHKI